MTSSVSNSSSIMQGSNLTSQTPEDLCRNRLALRKAESESLTHRLNRFVKRKRLIIYLVVGYSVADDSAWFLVIPLVIGLIPAVVWQNRLGRLLGRTDRAAEFHRHALARFENQWVDDGATGRKYLDAELVFADDLDIFGKASLFQFLCTAKTPIGRDTLANWLRQPADADEIRERQAAVRELSADPELREQLAMLSDKHRVDSQALRTWADVPELLPDLRSRVAGFVLATALVVAMVLALQLSVWITGVVLVLEVILFVAVRARLRQISSSARNAVSSLSYMSAVGSVVRGKSFNSQKLSDLQRTITALGRTLPGFAVYRTAADLPLLLLLLCQTTPWIERWRRSHAKTAEEGLLALGQLEALGSLAHFSFVQPDANYPEITSGTCYEAVELAHPLLPNSTRVTNDFRLNAELPLLMVSGSNMSGKSTMLRTVGLNAVLALCGAPVCAREAKISAFSIGTAMRFSDSLEHGTSYFYAVIKRLRRVMELQDDERPLLFLIDEILQGTNSRDRIDGARAVVRKLTDRGGIGMVTTHDLELTRIVEAFAGRAANVHFVDQLKNGEIHFDYKMRPGVVQTSNALTLMRSMGLDV